MNKSENIGALSAALSKLQGEIQNLHKDKAGYGYKYAELSSVLDVTRPLCTKYELAVTQLCTNLNELVGVETVLAHSSGEWISSTLYMPVAGGKGMSLAQAAGSVITYARRYSLAAILGIAQTDNDASLKEDLEKNTPIYDKLIELIKLKEMTLEQIKPWLHKFNVKKLSELKEIEIKEIINTIEGN